MYVSHGEFLHLLNVCGLARFPGCIFIWTRVVVCITGCPGYNCIFITSSAVWLRDFLFFFFIFTFIFFI